MKKWSRMSEEIPLHRLPISARSRYEAYLACRKTASSSGQQRREDRILDGAIRASADELWQLDVRLTEAERRQLREVVTEFMRSHRYEELGYPEAG